VTVNPPYLPVPDGDQNENPHFAAARHEMHGTLEEILAAGAKLLRFRGKLAMVHRANRLIDICCLMRQYRLEPKRIRFVHSRESEEAQMVLIEGSFGGKPGLRLEPPLFVYNENGEYGSELNDVFYGRKESL